jgi:hypothetical protein
MSFIRQKMPMSFGQEHVCARDTNRLQALLYKLSCHQARLSQIQQERRVVLFTSSGLPRHIIASSHLVSMKKLGPSSLMMNVNCDMGASILHFLHYN